MPNRHKDGLLGAFTGRHESGIWSPTRRQHVILFCAATFFFWTALYLYVPVLPVYAQSVGASLSMVGAIVAAYAIPQLLLRIPMGLLFDVLERRKFLLAGGIVMTSIGALVLGLAPDAWSLFLARICTGVGAATWVIFTVYFTGYYPQQNTRRAIGIIIFVQQIALVVSTYCGGVLAEVFGYTHVFYVAALLGIVALIAVLSASEPAIVRVKQISWTHLIQVATYPTLIIASLMGILSRFANWAGLFGFIPVYGTSIGASSIDLGIMTMLSLAASAIAALAAVYITKLWGNSFTILLGSILMGGAMLIVPLIHAVYLLKVVMMFNGFGQGLLYTTLMSLSIQAIPPQQRATAMGIYQATYAIGMLAGPLVSGLLAEGLGLAAVFYLAAFLSLVIAGIAYLPAVKCRGLG